MKKIIGVFIGLIILIFLCTSELIEPITKVFVWLITLDFNSPNISIIGQLVAKYGTWIISYLLVGLLFNAIGWFNSATMTIIYFIISTIISFLLSFLIMILENYLWIIAIVIGILLVICLALYVTLSIYRKRKSKFEIRK